VKEYIAKEKQIKKIPSPAQTLLELSGSWIDAHSSEEIIDDVKRNRRNSAKLKEGF